MEPDVGPVGGALGPLRYRNGYLGSRISCSWPFEEVTFTPEAASRYSSTNQRTSPTRSSSASAFGTAPFLDSFDQGWSRSHSHPLRFYSLRTIPRHWQSGRGVSGGVCQP